MILAVSLSYATRNLVPRNLANLPIMRGHRVYLPVSPFLMLVAIKQCNHQLLPLLAQLTHGLHKLLVLLIIRDKDFFETRNPLWIGTKLIQRLCTDLG